MHKKLTKIGNSWALLIDRPILDLLRIDEREPLSLSTDGKSLTITPLKRKSDKTPVQDGIKKKKDVIKTDENTSAPALDEAH